MDVVDVFGQAMQASAFLCDAAVAAGHALGVFEALRGHAVASLDEVADDLGVAGRRRLRALLDVLVALGAIERRDDAGAPRFAAAATVPPRPAVARAGWGLLADVIRSDHPLSAETDGDAVRRLHRHLAAAGAEAARELVAVLAGELQADLGAATGGEAMPHLGARAIGESMLDLGAGAGAYSRAFLEAQPVGQATLVDRREVLALAVEHLGPLAARAQFVEGDAATVELGGGHGVVLLANLLHLHSADMSARLCAAAASAVAPGGRVVIKDLRVDEDRRGPIEGLLFALNMALYTGGGDVHPTAQLRGWLAAAGLVDITEHRLAAAPDAIVVLGRRAAVSEV